MSGAEASSVPSPRGMRTGQQEEFLKRAALDNGRVLTERGKNAVNKIMVSAIEIFVDEGYGGLTMRKVAAKAGLALSNLQHYFPTREDIFEAILAVTREAYANTYDSVRADASLTPEGRLEKVVRLLLEDGKQPKTQSLFVNFWALAQTQEFARKMLEEGYGFQRSVIAGFIEAVNPALSPAVLTRRAALVTAQIEGLIVLIPQRNRFPSDIKGIEDDVVMAVLALAKAP
ncbi:TetR/AcrR family transcriptional regulator [Burkholderia sp. Ac-20392]|uniref:TetR/AcrR family transcriptional regulator n=1 Tax=Burkholderia sp. Ac-20392 TaxID=2703905 RepID=UPI00197D95C5|nr:TetR/AcrR family transcriptional regulator [Burkholderia sp. Ac-20392]MBN3796324.1 TetR/AcrR family transcriptional regulator [Burkholderia sp. Ac-20392]